MAKTPSLVETLQNDLKAKFDENMSRLAKLPLPVLIEIAKSLRINVTKLEYINPPNYNKSDLLTKERKNELITWMRSIPVGYNFGYNWTFTKEVPLYTKASEVYALVSSYMNESLLRASSGRNKDFIGVMISFNSTVENAVKNTK
jgi:hypothetical protein